MVDKKKSVASSTAGKSLRVVSGVVLFFGIVVTIMILISSFHEEGVIYTHVVFDWTGLITCIEVLFSSIFIFVLGRTIARMTDYAEAIYKNSNPDFDYDDIIASGLDIYPGDEVIWDNDGADVKVKIISYNVYEGYVLNYNCKLPDGSVKEIRPRELKKEEN